MQVADKRKSLLDDLAIRLQQNSDDHMETVTRLKQDNQIEVEELEKALLTEKVKKLYLQPEIIMHSICCCCFFILCTYHPIKNVLIM